MSRRPPAGGDRTEQNRATLKQLVKLESNKSCADCKINKHPRWASWSLGVFLCIRCSGVHRGMGTHISRVKSVDLDSWTDEQTQNMIRWGNTRANKYWEAKLADGHVPNEAKIQNFIKTKYDSKRWVMDGPMPDPSTLDDGADDDVPLNVVREKAIERSASLRNGSGSAGAGQTLTAPPSRARAPDVDLFGDAAEEMAPPARPSTTEAGVPRAGSQKAPAAPPKQSRPGESLLGIDFFGGASAAPPARPSSTGPTTPGVPGRADLKSSILSLYASKPAAPPPQQPQQPQQQPPPRQSNIDAFAGMQSAPLASPVQTQPSTQQSFGGMNDAFGSLSFTSPPQQQPQPKAQAVSNPMPSTSHARQASSKSGGSTLLSGGSFFDAKPVAAPKQTSPPSQPITAMHAQKDSIGSGFGDFSSSASPPAPAKSPPAATSSMGDLFDMSAPAPPLKPAAQKPVPPPIQQGKQPPPIDYSAFNLSQPVSQPQSQASPPKPAAPALSNFTTLSNMDAWGSNDAWATPDPPSQTQPQAAAPPIQTNATTTSTFKPAASTAMHTPFDSGWGDAPTSPQRGAGGGGFSVQPDEEFGGWSHASPVATSATSAHAPKPSGGGGAARSGGGFGTSAPPPMTTDDLFGNVWG